MITIRDIQGHVQELRAVHGFIDATPERQLAFLISEVGEVAREVLSLQSSREQASILERLGMELYDVIWNACAIGLLAGVDLEACIAQKVALNRTRVWNDGQPDESSAT